MIIHWIFGPWAVCSLEWYVDMGYYYYYYYYYFRCYRYCYLQTYQQPVYCGNVDMPLLVTLFYLNEIQYNILLLLFTPIIDTANDNATDL